MQSSFTQEVKKKYVSQLPEPVIICPALGSTSTSESCLQDFLLNIRSSNPTDSLENLTLKVFNTNVIRLVKNIKNNEAEEYQDFTGHRFTVTAVKLHTNGKHAVSGDCGGQVWLWDFALKKGESIGQHSGVVCGIDLKDSLVATYSTDRTIRLYNILTGITVKMNADKHQQVRRIYFARTYDNLNLLNIDFDTQGACQIECPYKYLSGQLSLEQCIIAAAIKNVETCTKKPEKIDQLKRILKKDEFFFEPGIQSYFEERCAQVKEDFPLSSCFEYL